ncbi:MAG: IS1 family transposase [Hormoscilla sp. GM7CHS1pb]|nr:IS1 family transposase [Hormoscilla sp. GM7CHS1pb]
MKCPRCGSENINKNGHRRGKQNLICKDCRRQFLEHYYPRGYSEDVKKNCLTMYVNGNGFRGIERITGVSHNTQIDWVKQAAKELPSIPENYDIPEVAEIDELHTYVNEKKNKKWLWTVVNHFKPGIITWVLGDRSAETFKPMWDIRKCWQCFLYVTDGWPVYPMFIEYIDHIVSKTYMTRVECENCRLRHYLARLKRKTLCYSKSEEMLRLSIKLLLHYRRYNSVPVPI